MIFWVRSFLLLAGVVLLGGCATVMNSGSEQVEVLSEPAGARVVVSKIGSGKVVFEGVTPATVWVNKSGGYFKSQEYLVRLEMEGYRAEEARLRSRFSWWYLGNAPLLVLWGGGGWAFFVDPMSGGIWNLETTRVERKLEREVGERSEVRGQN